jgi:hypothetical protein
MEDTTSPNADTAVAVAPAVESVEPVQTIADQPAPTAKAAAPRLPPKWETEAREKLRAGIKKFTKPLSDLMSRDANEGDTRLLVTDFLCDALGYDKYSDLTTEYRVKGEFADFGIRIDQDMVAFIEVKRVNTRLSDKHLRQVQMYAVNEGCEWVLLTNGHDWQVYHISAGLPVVMDLALSVSLFNDEPAAHKVNQLFHITRDSFRRQQIDSLWKAKRATSPKSLAGVLLAPSVVDAIRKELKRSTNQTVTNDEIAKLLQETVIKGDCFK